MSRLPLLLIATLVGSAAAQPEMVAAAPAATTTAVSTPAWPQSRDGLNRRVRIHNQTGWTMVRFQAADARSRAWLGDILGSQTLNTGASWAVTIDDGSGSCVYVFRAEFSNGQALERGSINVCEIADYYFTR